ncbi:GntR family transcriptional regulator [Anopheles sinensis]|uniref:GntR family transcriptional regulator n=1 Tax=Anopheles sinensis TaxID=74873 RepID=A0A084VCZ5_ANOSI|nr:GntR family transcriptional regulator [Anopheles sinensis]
MDGGARDRPCRIRSRQRLRCPATSGHGRDGPWGRERTLRCGASEQTLVRARPQGGWKCVCAFVCALVDGVCEKGGQLRRCGGRSDTSHRMVHQWKSTALFECPNVPDGFQELHFSRHFPGD